MNTISSAQGRPALPSLEAFRESASRGDSLRVSVQGQQYAVLAQGHMSSADGTGRRVAWVQSDVDTIGLFVGALSQTYGAKVSNVIAEALGLDPSPGKPLASRTVQQALDMASTGLQALSGVDYFTELQFSSKSGGMFFQECIGEMGVDPATLSADTRSMLDQRMHARFEEAAAKGDTPVSVETASAWLKAEWLVLNSNLS